MSCPYRELKDVTREELIAMMVGRSLSSEYPREERKRGRLVVEAKNLVNQRLNNVSLKIYRGELLGISGLVGAGRTELARAIMESIQLIPEKYTSTENLLTIKFQIGNQ